MDTLATLRVMDHHPIQPASLPSSLLLRLTRLLRGLNGGGSKVMLLPCNAPYWDLCVSRLRSLAILNDCLSPHRHHHHHSRRRRLLLPCAMAAAQLSSNLGPQPGID
ncbi:uncharacterized protein BP01DRAFT_93626 [Aspergillus saccharolyticus JOP 1030-1]|uniref:Uncharacterized protein n=1 Tax=Aspergillus saccharolyticus JOP 1030-1 TaxID=1450539 RepID=A0A318ZJB6_9EURO|nr:hypothetical protein BP01DRAFT_93626 [Aspergillus saccharolyticus JOP 1030-1]PYH43830.1 hypothetical protein BP01DRAFT_93626 [Aspergillus saccharolyticus JOP 1030-1]